MGVYMKKVIGIDIGGTKIAVVLASQAGEIIEKQVFKTGVRSDTQICLEKIISTIKGMLLNRGVGISQLAGIGVCIPGPIGDIPHVISRAPNLPGWNGINIDLLLRRHFKVPIFCNNDANAACIAEKLFGHGKNVNTFLYVTISTGIGAGLIINNDLIMGASNSAGELGHCIVEPLGPKCNCGKVGCLEAISSGTAIANIAKDIVSLKKNVDQYRSEYVYKRFRQISGFKKFDFSIKNKLSALNSVITAKDVAKCAKQGDVLSMYIFWRAGYYFGIGISNILQLINPQMIALGGSVTKTGPLYLEPMRIALREYAWKSTRNKCKIVKAKLRDKVGDYGSIGLVVDRL